MKAAVVILFATLLGGFVLLGVWRSPGPRASADAGGRVPTTVDGRGATESGADGAPALIVGGAPDRSASARQAGAPPPDSAPVVSKGPDAEPALAALSLKDALRKIRSLENERDPLLREAMELESLRERRVAYSDFQEVPEQMDGVDRLFYFSENGQMYHSKLYREELPELFEIDDAIRELESRADVVHARWLEENRGDSK